MKQMFYNSPLQSLHGSIVVPVLLLLDRRLPHGALRTWLLLRSLAGSSASTQPFSRKDFCQLAGVQRTALHSHLQKLSDLGYLQLYRVNRYELVVSFPEELVDASLFGKKDVAASLNDSIKDINNIYERLKRGADVRKKEQPVISTRPVELYREMVMLTPNATQRQQIEEHVTEIDLWQSTIQHWLVHGWNPRNLAGMLDLYQRGGPAGCRLCAKNAQTQDKSPLADTFATLDSLAKEMTRGNP